MKHKTIKKQSYHTSKKKAQSAVRARYANETALKEYVKLLIESNRNHHVSFKDILDKANAEAAEQAEQAEAAEEQNSFTYPAKPKEISPKMKALLKRLAGKN